MLGRGVVFIFLGATFAGHAGRRAQSAGGEFKRDRQRSEEKSRAEKRKGEERREEHSRAE